jgi:hypothetical protein
MQEAGLMITAAEFHRLVEHLGAYAADDIRWAENIKAPTDPDEFALEIIYVICNSGMQNVVARQIFDRIKPRLESGQPVKGFILGKSGKAAAIDEIWAERRSLLAAYLSASDKLEFCRRLPWIGNITCYHVAKNFGADVAKPDVHLQRLADREGVSPQGLCERLAEKTGYRVATVDTVLWRACALGLINSNTGAIDWSKSWEAA